MAYYCVATKVVEEGKSRVRFSYDLKDDKTTPHTLVLSDSVSFAFLSPNAVDQFGNPLTQAQRLAGLKAMVLRFFKERCECATGGAADLADLDTMVKAGNVKYP